MEISFVVSLHGRQQAHRAPAARLGEYPGALKAIPCNNTSIIAVLYTHPATLLPVRCVLLAQTLWCFSALTICPVVLSLLPGAYVLSKDLPVIPHTHVDMVSGAAAAVSFIGELFIIKAILVYDDSKAPNQGDASHSLRVSYKQHKLRSRKHMASCLDSHHAL
eukprot:GHRR01007767.1.p1 GENE.GHRR01007767.1~~GHRR01007767.1.p1  ORF type:complete len:163 (+),score=18.43 GHRR01007767.1:362-850(+)